MEKLQNKDRNKRLLVGSSYVSDRKWIDVYMDIRVKRICYLYNTYDNTKTPDFFYH